MSLTWIGTSNSTSGRGVLSRCSTCWCLENAPTQGSWAYRRAESPLWYVPWLKWGGIILITRAVGAFAKQMQWGSVTLVQSLQQMVAFNPDFAWWCSCSGCREQLWIVRSSWSELATSYWRSETWYIVLEICLQSKPWSHIEHEVCEDCIDSCTCCRGSRTRASCRPSGARRQVCPY